MISVLIIDDDKLTRKGLISIVNWAECGMEVAGEASNGEKALEFLENHPADLAVVDLTMPVMTGLEFIREAKIRYPALQYVILSFHEDFDYVQAALRLGTLDYISKIHLDHQDCTEIFKRVAMEMTGRSEQPDPAWDELQKQWLKPGWVYSGDTFDRLWESLAAAAPSLRRAERLLVRIHEAAREYFKAPMLPEAPALHGINEVRGYLNDTREYLAKFSERQTGMSSLILRAVKYIDANFKAPLSLSFVAGKVNLSRSHFAENFKRTVGMTFLQYLHSVRMTEARRLLADKDFPLSDIAKAVGFEDEKYFAALFSKQTGTSPHEFRKKI